MVFSSSRLDFIKNGLLQLNQSRDCARLKSKTGLLGTQNFLIGGLLLMTNSQATVSKYGMLKTALTLFCAKNTLDFVTLSTNS
ncbi:hypothetical protein BMF29_12320 [Comamonas kerstersii]|nr:hypothetical protein BMF38_15525 [Comamonas kerstersii]OOH90737.1 hypothetical protein BMF29_12320 [Comamonas kerstersii]